MKSPAIFAVAALLGALTIASDANAAAAVTTGAIKLLDGPIRGSALVTTLPANTRVGVLWCGMQKQWCLVSFHAKQGFVNAGDLQLIGGAVADTDEFDSNGRPNPRVHTSSKDVVEGIKSQGGSGPTYQVVNPAIMTIK